MRNHVLAAGAVAVVSGIAVTVLGIGPAMARPAAVESSKTQTVVATVTVAGNSTGEADATCGAGQLLTGGGYVIHGSSTAWRIYLDAPLNGTSWVVEPVNFSAQPLTFSAYAICLTAVPGKNNVTGYTTQVVQDSVNVPANQTGEADASCPAGELRTGGGYDVFNISANWSVYTNSPLASDSWNVEIDNEVPATTTFGSYAVCLAKTNSMPVTGLAVSTVDASATVPPNSVTTVVVACAAPAVMTGGGHVIASIGPDWSIQTSAPVFTNHWHVKVADLDTFSRTFDSMAVCLAKA